MTNANPIPVEVDVYLDPVEQGYTAALDANDEAHEVELDAMYGSGTADYNKLKNKPRIEGVELTGDKSFEDLGATALTNEELEALLK